MTEATAPEHLPELQLHCRGNAQQRQRIDHLFEISYLVNARQVETCGLTQQNGQRLSAAPRCQNKRGVHLFLVSKYVGGPFW